MDFKLDNINLSLNEKNKKLFDDLNDKKKDGTADIFDESNEKYDSFLMYKNFIEEKDVLLQTFSEFEIFALSEASIILTPDNLNTTVKLNKIVKTKEDLFNFKNRVIMLLELYQEQPGLIDPILEQLVRPLANGIFVLVKTLLKLEKNQIQESATMISLNCLSQIIYVLCKVRGYETVSKYFSSEVNVFEPIISFLLILVQLKDDSWTTIFVLTLWTSILGLIPFDIETVDTSKLIIQNLSKFYMNALSMSSNLREIAGYSASKFLTRKDIIQKGLLKQYLDWGVTVVLSQTIDNLDTFLTVGVLSSLSKIFRNGARKDLEPYVEDITHKIIGKLEDEEESKPYKELLTSNLVRKFRVRLAEKLALVILKPRNQMWRYKLNFKEFLTNKDIKQNEENFQETDTEENINYDLLEIIIECLLNGLTDKDYIVRWTAAKGVGRICERIDKDMVCDIFSSLLENMEGSEEGSLQGSCLAIAELAKRGLILPEQLHSVTSLINKILLFEVNKGAYCTGAFVRDSACYVVWALARAYSPDVMKPHVEKLSISLILTILFDKEVNIRRAASAAFQEHVGRQGYFPHGIEIITEADYFTLGNRTNCYLNISLFIAQYKEYYRDIVIYLASDRLYHSDISIRQNAAECLGLLLPFNKDLYLQEVFSIISKKITNSNINTRHGALLGLAFCLIGLNGKWDLEYNSRLIRIKVLESMSQNEKKVLEDSDYRKKFEQYYSGIKYTDYLKELPEEIRKQLVSFPSILNDKGYLKSKGAEIMRNGINCYIKLLSISGIQISEEVFFTYCNILFDNLKHPIVEIQIEASQAFRALMETYCPMFLSQKNENFKNELNNILKNSVYTAVNDSSVVLTRGFSLVLSEFFIDIIQDNLDNIVENLILNSKLKKSENNDAETRKFSIECLAIIMIKILNKNKSLNVFKGKEKDIMNTIIDGFNDYEIDRKRGDVGSKVRESCLQIFPSLMLAIFENGEQKLFDEYIMTYLSNILKQLSEKMNKIRMSAGNCLELFFSKLQNLLSSDSGNKKISSIKYFDLFINSFVLSVEVNDDKSKIQYYENLKSNSIIQKHSNSQWLEPSFSFPLLMNFFTKEEFTSNIFKGLIFSIGGITEDVAKVSKECFEKLNCKNDGVDDKAFNDIIKTVYDTILHIFENNKKDDLVILALYSTLEILLSKPYMKIDGYLSFVDKIQKYMIVENYNSANIHKLLICPEIYYNILLFEKENELKCHHRAMKSLLFLMAHKYPVVRKKAADKLYLYLLSLESPEEIDLDQDTIDTAGLFLAENDWCLPLNEIKEPRNEIANLLQIPLK